MRIYRFNFFYKNANVNIWKISIFAQTLIGFMQNNYSSQHRGNTQEYRQYLKAMDAISIEKVASASTFFEPGKENVLVDVGMASGTSSAILANLFPGMQITGVDINPQMVEIARKNYQLPNLSFQLEDGEKLSGFEKGTISGFFNCSSIHHITSYNKYDNNHALNTIARQVELLKERGVLVIRDFVKPEEKEVILELSTIDKPDRPDDAGLLLLFSTSARSMAPVAERGFPVLELRRTKKNTRRFRLFYTDAVEFIRRKDYYANWDVELQEEYGYFTQKEFEECFRNLGLRIILSSPIYNQWIINNRYRNQFRLLDLNGEETGFPPTNYLIAGEKITGGREIKAIRRLPVSDTPFLQFSSYRNKSTNEIFDVVKRPNEVSDIIPYYKEGDKITVLAKHGYPRPLVNLKTDSPVLDNKHFSGYIPEGITVAETTNLQVVLAERFGIQSSFYETLERSLNYYPSPGGICERVSSHFIHLNCLPGCPAPLSNGFSGFKESGFIHLYDAAQLLNTAQTGALVEARLELNIYHLFRKLNIPLPEWLGEKIKVKYDVPRKVSRLPDLLSLSKQVFTETNISAGFLKTGRTCFAELGVEESSSVLEYVYPGRLSSNTLVTLPVCKMKGEIYAGLEVRNLPVPQIYSGNSTIITVPAKRLPKDVENIFHLNQYLSGLKIGKSKVERYFKLGEKYYPSTGVTTEQVYPFAVCLDAPSKQLEWVALSELLDNVEKLEDAHLLICLARLKHALKKEEGKSIQLGDLIDFLQDRDWWAWREWGRKREITPNMLIEKDLGIYGDDGDELLFAIQEEFNLTFTGEAFGLKENEYLFSGEGMTFPFFQKEENIIPLTVEMLYNAMIKAVHFAS